MAAVVFALGDRPGLSEGEARELAEVLGRRRTLASQSAARKILTQAQRDRVAGEVSTDVELDQDELGEVAAVLAQERSPEELPRFERLRDEIARALAGLHR